MENRNPRNRFAALSALTLAVATAAAFMAPAATAQLSPCTGTDSPFLSSGHITLASPLAEQITVTDLLVLAVEESAVGGVPQVDAIMAEVNGLDAYVIQLPCLITNGVFTLQGDDNDLELYNLGIWWVGAIASNRVLVTDPDSSDVTNKLVPAGGPFEYVVVITDSGIPNGLRTGGIPNVYTVTFDFEWQS